MENSGICRAGGCEGGWKRMPDNLSVFSGGVRTARSFLRDLEVMG